MQNAVRKKWPAMRVVNIFLVAIVRINSIIQETGPYYENIGPTGIVGLSSMARAQRGPYRADRGPKRKPRGRMKQE